MQRIVLTGGGTAGHVMPNLALVDDLKSKGFEILYIGGKGIEKTLAINSGLRYQEIATGKLRRYFSWANFADAFRVVWGTFEAFWILLRFRPRIVFSKGGFVSVPVALAARILGIPLITHEADLTPGLATRLIQPFAKVILYSFEETARYLPASKSKHSGLPIRRDLLNGSAENGRRFCGFEKSSRQTLLIMGGSLGAGPINDVVFSCIDALTKDFDVIHLCGPGKKSSIQNPHYRAFEFLKDELKDVLALADLVVSRAGANAIFELLALKKPMLLIPFVQGSRGDQVDNAKSFVKKGFAHLLEEKDLNRDSLLAAIFRLRDDSSQLKTQQERAFGEEALQVVLRTILEVAS